MAAVIVADQLTKWYGARLAVDRVSLTVERGEVMGLLGPNGSGKTTILRLLAGYLHPSGGTARIAGLDVVSDAFEARRHVGYVPEDAPLYDGMSAREFLFFMGRLKGLGASTLTAAVAAGTRRLGLEGVDGMQMGKLSRGYRQRVAIAQALLAEPDLLILDEPTNGLDPRQIIEMRDLIRSLAGERTLLVTSHILGEIERVADRVAILLQGRLLGVHALRSAEAPRLRLRVRGDEVGVRTCLLHVAGVQRVEAMPESGPGVVRCFVDVDSEWAAESVAAALAAGGFGLLAMERAPVDLETLFLRLTGERERIRA